MTIERYNTESGKVENKHPVKDSLSDLKDVIRVMRKNIKTLDQVHGELEDRILKIEAHLSSW